MKVSPHDLLRTAIISALALGVDMGVLRRDLNTIGYDRVSEVPAPLCPAAVNLVLARILASHPAIRCSVNAYSYEGISVVVAPKPGVRPEKVPSFQPPAWDWFLKRKNAA